MPDQIKSERSMLQSWWETILKFETSIQESNADALVNMHGCETILGFKSLPLFSFPDLPTSELFTRRPAFKNLEFSDILFLRKSLQAGDSVEELSQWAESLLRFIEINLGSVIKKARVQFGSSHTAQQAILQLSAFLLDFYYETGDLRFLNATLKMIDLTGLVTVKKISNDLKKQGKEHLAALYQVRLLLMVEAALQQLQNQLTR
jgi:hypothetical protein